MSRKFQDGSRVPEPQKIFSPSELDSIQELKSRVRDISDAEHDFQNIFYLVHWLRAQSFNVNRTESMIREALKWRRDKDLKKLVMTGVDPGLLKMLQQRMIKTKQGYPVMYVDLGKFDIRGATSAFGKGAVCDWAAQRLAAFETDIMEIGTSIFSADSPETTPKIFADGWMIIDMKALSLLHLMSTDVISASLTIVQTLTRYFPICCGTFCFINANKLFNIGFKVVSPILSGSNMTILVFGKDEETWKNKLLDVMERDQLELIVGESNKS